MKEENIALAVMTASIHILLNTLISPFARLRLIMNRLRILLKWSIY
jgi:hypothetical protein